MPVSDLAVCIDRRIDTLPGTFVPQHRRHNRLERLAVTHAFSYMNGVVSAFDCIKQLTSIHLRLIPIRSASGTVKA